MSEFINLLWRKDGNTSRTFVSVDDTWYLIQHVGLGWIHKSFHLDGWINPHSVLFKADEHIRATERRKVEYLNEKQSLR